MRTRTSRQIESLKRRLQNLETVVGEPAQAYDSWPTYTGLKGSISSIYRQLERLDTPPPKPEIERRITFTGDNHTTIHRRIIQWLAGHDTGTGAVTGEYCALAFTAPNHRELRQAVLTYAQEHQL